MAYAYFHRAPARPSVTQAGRIERRLLPALAGACALLASAGVFAERIQIGSTTVEVPLPPGHCRLDPSHETDRRVFSYLREASRGINKVLQISTECRVLEKWRAGEVPYLTDYAYVLAPSKFVDRRINMERSEYLRRVAQKLEQSQGQMERALSKGKEKAEAAGKDYDLGLQIGETRNLGMIDRDEVGLVQKAKMRDTGSHTMGGVYGVTMLNSKIATLYWWRDFQGPETINALQDDVSGWVRSAVRSN